MTVHKKSLGQHFLQNIGAAHRIVSLLDIESGDRVLEIGPGGGVLTGILAELPITLVAVEIDSRLASELSERFSSTDSVTVRNEDILEFDFASLGSSRSWKLVGNLPYNLTSPILERVFENSRCFSMAVFTVQREVANRLTSEIGTSDYSSLTVFAQTYCDVERVFLLKPGSFFPRPKVSSAVVRLTLREPIVDDRNELDGFHRFVQSIFSHRRKTIVNCLIHVTDLNKKMLLGLLDRLGISALNRPQNLSLEQFVAIYAAVNEVSNA
jgi:16S rRNA (adenine1518-N6/adenine1519-N6)-dimethyltransferase